jgi:hypothetical protein
MAVVLSIYKGQSQVAYCWYGLHKTEPLSTPQDL